MLIYWPRIQSRISRALVPWRKNWHERFARSNQHRTEVRIIGAYRPSVGLCNASFSGNSTKRRPVCSKHIWSPWRSSWAAIIPRTRCTSVQVRDWRYDWSRGDMTNRTASCRQILLVHHAGARHWHWRQQVRWKGPLTIFGNDSWSSRRFVADKSEEKLQGLCWIKLRDLIGAINSRAAKSTLFDNKYYLHSFTQSMLETPAVISLLRYVLQQFNERKEFSLGVPKDSDLQRAIVTRNVTVLSNLLLRYHEGDKHGLSTLLLDVCENLDSDPTQSPKTPSTCRAMVLLFRTKYRDRYSVVLRGAISSAREWTDEPVQAEIEIAQQISRAARLC